MLFLNRLKIPIVLLAVCLVAYLPLSSFAFALKNDAFVFNFPNKYFFSEAIRAGYSPAWNPYLNFGFPLYADPGFAWWHPITWIFGLIGYNAYTFSLEILFYIYLSGLGMYWLVRKLGLRKDTSFATAIMFMCSGFFIGNLQHINFLTCSAFLPWLFGYWWLYQKDASLKNLLGCSLVSYLLCTGGHPAIPIAAGFYFFCCTILYFFYLRGTENIRCFVWRQLKLVIIIVVLLSPLILSYYQIFPYYSRSVPVDQGANRLTGFTPQSYLSFLYPFATIKNFEWFGTDVSMRNGYFSIPGFLLFIGFLFKKQKSKLQWVVFISGLLLLLLSVGGTIKQNLYEHLPVFSRIRTNGEFRVFAIFSFLICSSFQLEGLVERRKNVIIPFKKLLTVLLILSTLGIIIVFAFFGTSVFNYSFQGTTFILQIKDLIDNIKFEQGLLLAFVLSVMLSLLYLLVLKRSNLYFSFVLLLDLIISCWMLLPITGVGKSSVAQIQHILDKSPKGFPSPLAQIESNILPKEQILISNWAWYDKKINHSQIGYPSKLKSTEIFFHSEDTAIIRNKPAIFLKNGSAPAELIDFKPNLFHVKMQLQSPDTLIVLQNYFTGWAATINKRPASIIRYLNTFIAVPLREDSRDVQLRFYAFRHLFQN